VPCPPDTLACDGWCIDVWRSSDRRCLENRRIPAVVAFAGSRGHAFGPLPVEEDGKVTAAKGRDWGMGVYHATGDDRHLSVSEASTPRRGGSVHDVFGFAHRAPVVVLVHHSDPVGVGGGIPVHGRGEGIGGEVWRGVQGIS